MPALTAHPVPAVRRLVTLNPPGTVRAWFQSLADNLLDPPPGTGKGNAAAEPQAGLRQSHELLILISPASIQSDWVKHEAGIADVLDLPITLVMLHVDLDKRPEPLKDRLAISINELPIYFESVRKKVEKA